MDKLLRMKLTFWRSALGSCAMIALVVTNGASVELPRQSTNCYTCDQVATVTCEYRCLPDLGDVMGSGCRGLGFRPLAEGPTYASSRRVFDSTASKGQTGSKYA